MEELPGARRCRRLASQSLAGCGSSSSSSSSRRPLEHRTSDHGSASSSAPAPAADPAVEKLVPAAIKSKGTLTVAADASYAPNEFFASDGHTVIGMDADLCKALGRRDGAEGRTS